MLLPTAVAVGDFATATIEDQLIAAVGGDSFTGTPYAGSYSTSKLIQKFGGRLSGTSNASGNTSVAVPGGATGLLMAVLGMNLIVGQTILVRTDFTTLSTLTFQLRNAATPYGALATTTYDFNFVAWYQI